MRFPKTLRPLPCALALISLASVAACAASAPPPPAAAPTGAPAAAAAPSTTPPPPPPGDDGRLPATVTPQRYALTLRIDPTQPRFSGVTTIQVDVPAPTFNIVLHGRDLHITRALARVGAGATEIAARTSMRTAHGGAQPEELVLSFDQPLPTGTAQLEITYDAPFSRDLAGAYRVQERGAWYAYTQFESTDARRAFPCFDEPGFKTPFDLTLVTPPGQIALGNTPETSHEDGADGMVVHHFDTSRPLPSYLVAFAVGDFDIVQGQTSPFPIRAITTKGRGALTGLALDAAAALVARLGDYFGIRYPYPKLDLVAVPDFAAGAMENPGLVTFRDQILLLDPKHATTSARRGQAETIAHEFAHQWFGDLVTAAWWDDIWLNEGFASWAAAKMVDAWKPSFGAQLEQIAGAQHVMDTDALRSSRAVRQPVHSNGEAQEAFDGITYTKGAAVLRMIESWLGPDTFRRGVQRYLHEHAWHNAKASDLFDALDYVSAQKVGDLASGFLDQTGVPSVTLGWKCAAGASKVELRESEWRPLGATAGAGGANDAPRSWTLPVCVSSEGVKARSCFTLGSSPIERSLGARCPTWLYPNADQAGYYRFVLDRPQLLALARGERGLDPADRFGLLSNAWAEVRQGALEPGALLDVLPLFDGDANRLVVEEISHTLSDMDHALVGDDDRAAFRRYVAARFAGRKALLGWEAAKGEDDDRALERRAVLHAMGALAYDGPTLDEAEKITRKWLADPSSVQADQASVAVPLASLRAGASRLDELRAAAKAARTPQERVVAISAMGMFDDPAVLKQALDLALTDELRLSELRNLFRSAFGHASATPVLYAWEKEHWTALRTRLGGRGAGMLLRVAGSLCTRADTDDARAFFEAGTQGLEATRRALDESLEEAGLCTALREHGAASVAKYLGTKR
jgi:aminopeptidase N